MNLAARTPRALPMLALMLLGWLVASCGGGGTTPADSPPIVLSVNLPASVVLGSTVRLSANVSGSVDTWQWTLSGPGPGSVADPRPNVRFDNLGIYTGSVIATNAAGSSAPFSFSTKVITEGVVAEAPEVQSVGPIGDVGFAGQPIGFLATATNFPERWEWNFGGGAIPATSSAPNPQVVLTTEGTHTGTVTISNIYGASELFFFTYSVTEPPTSRPALVAGLSIGGEMGAPGTEVTVNAQVFDFPTYFEWDFGAGSNPAVSLDPVPTFTLGPPQLYTGFVKVKNHRGGETEPFTYSTGGFETARMAQQFGGCQFGANTILPLDGGGLACWIASGSTSDYDLDPRMTTMRQGVPQLPPVDTLLTSCLVITDAAGAPLRVLRWTDVDIVGLARGPLDNLLIHLLYRPAASVPIPTQVNVAPHPEVVMHQVDATSQVIIVALTVEGQVQWVQSETRQSGTAIGKLIAGPDGSVFFTGSSTDQPPFSSKLRKLTPQGAPVWEVPLPAEPSLLRGTPSGGVYYADQLTLFSEDRDGSVDGTDMFTKRGLSDALLTRLSAAGEYIRTIQLPGTAACFAGQPTGLLVRPDSSVILAGGWDGGDLDFDPGPGVVSPPGTVCHPSTPFPPRVYALHLSPEGAFQSVETWDADRMTAFAPEVRIADFGSGGYAVGWRMSACGPPLNDLDPGPGTVFPQSGTDVAIVRVDETGQLVAHAEWKVPSGIVRSLVPSSDGGLHAMFSRHTQDMDPGPVVFDPSPFINEITPWHLFLTEDLRWGVPAP